MYEPPPAGYARTVCRYEMITIASTLAIEGVGPGRQRHPREQLVREVGLTGRGLPFPDGEDVSDQRAGEEAEHDADREADDQIVRHPRQRDQRLGHGGHARSFGAIPYRRGEERGTPHKGSVRGLITAR